LCQAEWLTENVEDCRRPQPLVFSFLFAKFPGNWVGRWRASRTHPLSNLMRPVFKVLRKHIASKADHATAYRPLCSKSICRACCIQQRRKSSRLPAIENPGIIGDTTSRQRPSCAFPHTLSSFIPVPCRCLGCKHTNYYTSTFIRSALPFLPSRIRADIGLIHVRL
jgi:hypothetical protein